MKPEVLCWAMMVGWVLGWPGSVLWAEPSGPAPGLPPSAPPSPPTQAGLPVPSPPAQEQPPSSLAAAPLGDFSPLASREAELAILKSLTEKSQAEFVDTPLQDVLKYWQDLHKIPIVLDRKALETAGIPADAPVTIQIPKASFRGILEHVLEDLGLSWTIRHQSLWITTPDVADQYVISRVYAVEDLLSGRSEDLKTQLEELSEVIQTTVAPASWREVGGVGSMAPLIVQGKGCLVIQQSWPIHLQVMELLEEIRQVARSKPSEPKSPTPFLPDRRE